MSCFLIQHFFECLKLYFKLYLFIYLQNASDIVMFYNMITMQVSVH